MRKAVYFIITLLPLLASCGGGNHSSSEETEKTYERIALRHTELLSMEEERIGHSEDSIVTRVRIRNPWDTTKVLARYLLVPKGMTKEEPGYVSIHVPLQRSVIFSAVHTALISELGGENGVAGVCDTKYIYDAPTLRRLKEGEVADCGTVMQPVAEKILRVNPDGILLSPYEDGTAGSVVQSTGVPLISAADYMESTPLGRAEWMRFYGRLYGKGNIADSLFMVTESDYMKVKERAGKAAKNGRPKVLFDRVYGNEWSVPTSGSVMGNIIMDAGGANPFSKLTRGGSAQLSPEQVLYEGADADVWLIRYYQPSPLTLKEIESDRKAYGRIKAFKTGNVYGSDTSESRIFEDGAFHPQFVLEDIAAILHPELRDSTTRHYFHKLAR